MVSAVETVLITLNEVEDVLGDDSLEVDLLLIVEDFGLEFDNEDAGKVLYTLRSGDFEREWQRGCDSGRVATKFSSRR